MFNFSAFVRQYPPDGVNIEIGSDPQELPEDDEVMVLYFSFSGICRAGTRKIVNVHVFVLFKSSPL